MGKIEEALSAFQALCDGSGYPMTGTVERNWMLPSAVGAIRTTCLAPTSMTAGDLRRSEPMLIVGFEQLGDFFAELAAANLREQGILAESAELDIGGPTGRSQLNTVQLASHFERAPFRAQLVELVKPRLGNAERVGFPAVLGLSKSTAVLADLEGKLERPVFEIPTLPPSVPGMRLHRILVRAIRNQGGQVFDGMEAIGAESRGPQVQSIVTESAARQRRQEAEHFVLATGGFLGGGVEGERDGRIREIIFGLPIAGPEKRSDWFHRDFFTADGHPLFWSGVATGPELRPIDRNGQRIYDNLMVIGASMAHHDGIQERSSEGVALTTGYMAGRGWAG
jgi:glycerol-3-phosphate dehydrogenase subunit B